MKVEVISAEELELEHEIEAMATRSSHEKKLKLKRQYSGWYNVDES